MTPDLRFPTPPSPVATRTRVKWENLAILAGGAVVATFAVVIVLIQGAGQATPPPTVTEDTATPALVEDATATPTSELTMTDALGLVEEARQFISEARWDEAAERLESVPAELRDAAGVSALAAQLEASRTRHDQLRAELTAAVEARQWTEATTLIERLAAIAPLDAELLAQQATVQQALAPATAAPSRTTEAPETASPTTPNAARPSTTRPARPASSGRPAASTPAAAPAATPAATGGGRPAATGGGVAASAPAALDPLAPIELTPEQEAELAAALGYAAGELQ